MERASTLPARPRRRTSGAVRHQRWRRVTTGVVVAGLLAAAAVTAWVLSDDRDPAEVATREAMATLAGHLEGYRAKHGVLPDDLVALAGVETCYAGGACPRDAWGTPIEYRPLDTEAGTFRLRSRGPDREPATADDLVWPPGTTFPTDPHR